MKLSAWIKNKVSVNEKSLFEMTSERKWKYTCISRMKAIKT